VKRTSTAAIMPDDEHYPPTSADLHGRISRHVQRYDHRAVETPWQRRYVARFEAS
jgi:hypothetical protein